MIRTTCPSQEEIRAYLLGKSSEAPEFVAHIESCNACSAVATELDSDCDSVVLNLRTELTTDTQTKDSYATADLSGKQLGDYHMIRRIGAGGMGTVYEGLHIHLKKIVAIKVLPKWRAESLSAVPRFRTEMQAAARVDHAHVVRAMDARKIQGQHLLVMELVEGIDLSRLVKQFGPLPIADACEMIYQAALGIESIHAAGMIHRDIKPSNLILSNDGIIKVVDLGLASLHTSEQSLDTAIDHETEFDCDDASVSRVTKTGHRLGTAKYVAPEQARGIEIDHRADIFSLGCTFFYLLSGEVPYVNGWDHDAVEQLETPSVRNLRKAVPRQLDDLVRQMLSQSASSRCADAQQVADRLGELIQHSEFADVTEENSKAPIGLQILRQRVTKRKRDAARRRLQFRSVVGVILVAVLLSSIYFIASQSRLRAIQSEAIVGATKSHNQEDSDSVVLAMTSELRASLVSAYFDTDLAKVTTRHKDANRSFIIWDAKTGKRWKEATLQHSKDGAGEDFDLSFASASETTGFLRPVSLDNSPVIVTRTTDRRWVAPVGDGHLLFRDHSSRIKKSVDVGISKIEATAMSGNLTMVAVGGGNHISLWRFGDQERVREYKCTSVKQLMLSYDGDVVACLSREGTLELANWRTLESFNPPIGTPVTAAVFVHTKPYMIHASEDGLVSTLHCETTGSFDFDRLALNASETVIAIGVSASDENVAYVTSQGRVISREIEGFPQPTPIDDGDDISSKTASAVGLMSTLKGHTRRVTSLAFTRDGSKLVSGSDDRTIRVFDVKGGELLETHQRHGKYVRDVALINSDQLLVSISEDKLFKGFAWPSMVEQFSIELPERPTIFAQLPDNGQFVIGTRDGRLYGATPTEGSKVLPLGQVDPMTAEIALCVTSLGETVAGDIAGNLHVFDGVNEEPFAITPIRGCLIMTLALSQDQRTLICGSSTGELIALRWPQLEEIKRWKGHDAPITKIAISEQRSEFATVCRNGNLSLWSMSEFSPVSATRAHDKTIRDIAYSSDGKILATASHDHTIKLWKLDQLATAMSESSE